MTGTSMEPTFRAGDHLFVTADARRQAAVGPGEVVLLRHPHQADLVIVKRVVRTEGAGLWVQGDNAQSTDSRHFGVVPTHCLLGVVTGYLGENYGAVPRCAAPGTWIDSGA